MVRVVLAARRTSVQLVRKVKIQLHSDVLSLSAFIDWVGETMNAELLSINSILTKFPLLPPRWVRVACRRLVMVLCFLKM